MDPGQTATIVIGITVVGCFCCFFIFGSKPTTQEQRLNRFVTTGKSPDTPRIDKILEVIIPKPKKDRDVIKISV